MIEEVKATLSKQKLGIAEAEELGLFILIADAGQGKTFVSDRLAKYFGVEKLYVNEPDAPFRELMYTLDDIIAVGTPKIMVIDSLSVTLDLGLTSVVNQFENSKAGAKKEGMSPIVSASLTKLSQYLVSAKRIVYITLSLADYTDHDMVFTKCKGYSNGILWSKDRKLSCSYRKESDRDTVRKLTIDELLESSVAIVEKQAKSINFSYRDLDLTNQVNLA